MKLFLTTGDEAIVLIKRIKSRMNAITITKKYVDGGNSGYYKIIVEKTTISKKELLNKWALYSPIYKNNAILLGVDANSGYNLWNINDVATALLKQRICGNCIIVFEEQTDKQYEILCGIIKYELTKMGLTAEKFIGF